nr:transposase [Serratia marcescens]
MEVGTFCALHTYGRQLNQHPHCYQRCKTDPPQRLNIDPRVNLLL